MGRPTIAEQISKAAAEGNLEKVKELAGKLEKPTPKVKKKPKVKTKPKKNKIEVYEDEIEEQEIPLNTSEGRDNSGFTTSARDPNKKKKYIDEDGNEKVMARIVPFKVIKNRKNKWEDDPGQETADIEFDKKVHAGKSAVKRERQAVSKIKVKCSRCKDVKIVWPGEVSHNNWACDECLTSNKPSRD